MSCDTTSTVLQAGWLALTATALYLIRSYQISSVQVRAVTELSRVASRVLECALDFEKEKLRIREQTKTPANPNPTRDALRPRD